MLENVDGLCKLLAALPNETNVRISTNLGALIRIKKLNGLAVLIPDDSVEPMNALVFKHSLLGNHKPSSRIVVRGGSGDDFKISSVTYDGKTLYIGSEAMTVWMENKS